MSGHHADHACLQKHSVGDLYPLAIVGYGNGDTTSYVVEHLTNGTVLANAFTRIVYQGPYSLVHEIALDGFSEGMDTWLSGRPHYEGTSLVM